MLTDLTASLRITQFTFSILHLWRVCCWLSCITPQCDMLQADHFLAIYMKLCGSLGLLVDQKDMKLEARCIVQIENLKIYSFFWSFGVVGLWFVHDDIVRSKFYCFYRFKSIHPSIYYLLLLRGSGRGGSSLSREAQTSLSPATSSSSSGGTPRRSQASRET